MQSDGGERRIKLQAALAATSRRRIIALIGAVIVVDIALAVVIFGWW
jgi:hypothetical protein